MHAFTTATETAYRTDDEADPRDVADGMALVSFRQSVADLLLSGWSEADLTRLIAESLPLAEEIDETVPANCPF